MRDLWNKLITRIGVDRVAHFAVFGLCVAIAAFFGWLAMVVAFVLLLALSWLKEVKLDATPDKWDFIAGASGGVLTVIVYLLALLLP